MITDLVVADSATILISRSSDAAVELKATGDLGLSWMKITGLSIGMREVYSRNMDMSVVADSRVTPLFNSLRMKIEKLWRLLQGWAGTEAGETVSDEEAEADEDETEMPAERGASLPRGLGRIASDPAGERLFEYAEVDDEFLEALFEEVDISRELESASYPSVMLVCFRGQPSVLAGRGFDSSRFCRRGR